MDRIKDYALKNYPKLFKQKRLTRDSKGKISNITYTNITPTVVDAVSHWRVYAHIDSSPIILSKDV